MGGGGHAIAVPAIEQAKQLGDGQRHRRAGWCGFERAIPIRAPDEVERSAGLRWQLELLPSRFHQHGWSAHSR
jgi:hypothetical protein